MSFKLTYATMFEPPPALHARFDAAVARVRERLGGRYYLYIDGEDRAASRYFTKSNPANTQEILGEFAAAGAEDADAAVRAAAAAWPSWKRTPVTQRARLMRRVAQLIEERVYELAAALSLEVGKNRMEALGETQETADFFTLYSQDFELNHGFSRALPDDPLANYASHNRSVLKPYGPWVVIAPFNFPLALAGGSDRGRAHHRQYGHRQGRQRHPLGRPAAGGLHPRRRGAARGVQLPQRPGCRRGCDAGLAPDDGGRDLYRFARGGDEHRAGAAGAAFPAPVHRGDGRQERLHRQRARGHGARGRGHRALRVRHGGPEMLRAVAAVRARAGRGRPHRVARWHKSPRSKSVTRRCSPTGWAR